MSENEANGGAPQVASDATGTAMASVPVSAQRQRLGELAQQLAEAAQRKRALRAKIETMSRAQQAAQGEAVKARQQWSAKLRDSDGTLTRDIQKLRAAERSALSLAEEYQAMESEIATELPRLELELAAVADSCIKGKHDVAKEVAAQAYDRLLSQAGEQIAVAFALFAVAENAGKPHREKSDMDELASRFFGGLNSAVRRLGDPSIAKQVAQKMALPPMDLGDVDMQLVASPAARSRMQRNIELKMDA